MKLLGWMHRKFRQNSGEPFGRTLLDEQSYHTKQNYNGKPLKPQKERMFRNSFAGLEEATAAEEDDYEEESSSAISELFHGLLAIGTLGSDPVDNATPTFGVSVVENLTEKQTEVTESDLRLINDELEKVLVLEAKDEMCDISSGRNSHVSVNGKQSDVSEGNGNGTAVCPLQGYLFGSPIELPETTPAAKKEHRPSLGELFLRSKMAEENNGRVAGKCEREKRAERDGERSGVHLVKKILKRRTVNASSRSSGGTGAADSVSAETKLHKILHIFHRKVHPESSEATKKCSKSDKNQMKNNIPCDASDDSGDLPLSNDDILIIPQRSIGKEGIRRYKCHSNPPRFSLSGSESNGNREYWIKTDAEYLVLEL